PVKTKAPNDRVIASSRKTRSACSGATPAEARAAVVLAAGWVGGRRGKINQWIGAQANRWRPAKSSRIARQPIAASSAPVIGQNTLEAKPPTMVKSAIAWRAPGPAICTTAMRDGMLSAIDEPMPITAPQEK